MLTWVIFGLLQPTFFSVQNLINLLTQSSSAIVAATGMTLVLMTAGVDLSVGAVMFLAAAVAGKLALAGVPLPVIVLAMIMVGAGAGAFNAALMLQLRLLPFVVTLATLYLGRGFALELTQTRAMNLPEEFLRFGRPAWAIGTAVLVVGVADSMLRRTVVGPRLRAFGANQAAVRLSGLSTGSLMLFAYVVCGLCAAVAALLTLGQLGTVSPKFGEGREFTAIAAAVLGGSSLFGGRGSVFPGTVVGALLMQSVESGLVMVNADPYAYPLIISGVIFLAVMLDALRRRGHSSQRR
jgi:ribose transport system permease protein